MTPSPDPAERLAAFREDLSTMAVPIPSRSRSRYIAGAGAVLMAAGAVLLIYGYSVVHGSDNPLDQRDGVSLGLVGLGLAVIGAALFVYGAITQFLRYWLVRLGHQLQR